MLNVIAIRPNGLTVTQQGFDSWKDAMETVAHWGARGDMGLEDDSPVYIADSSNVSVRNLSQFTVGELRRECGI